MMRTFRSLSHLETHHENSNLVSNTYLGYVSVPFQSSRHHIDRSFNHKELRNTLII